MKNVPESTDGDELLDAVLADDEWHALNRSLKREALAAMGAAHRTRRCRRWLTQTVCAIGLVAGAGWWWRSPTPPHPPVAQKSGQPALPGAEDAFVSEETMLAMFPAGTCVVAEVDGRKELVFFDAKQAEDGFVVGRSAPR